MMGSFRRMRADRRQEAGLKSGTYKPRTAMALGLCGAEGFAVAVGGVARAAEDAFDAADVVNGFAVGALAGLLFSIDFHF